MKAEYYENETYAYSEVFWGEGQNREYEHQADSLVLREAIREYSDWIADLGGGFGRLVPALRDRASNVLIVDGSVDLLQEARERYGHDLRVRYVRANVYHLPFRDASIRQAACMRVMHHIEEPDLFFAEANRVISRNLYLEFPNKRHALQRIRFYFLKDRRVDIRSSHSEMRDSLFLNFTLAFMRSRIRQITAFSIKRISGLSFLRQARLKQLPISFLLALERMLQRAAFLAELAPSILLTLSKQSSSAYGRTDALEELLSCPRCQAAFTYDHAGTQATCGNSHAFFQNDGIWDFYIE